MEEEGIEKLSMDLRKIAIIANRIAPSTLGLSQFICPLFTVAPRKPVFVLCCAFAVHCTFIMPQ